MKIIFRLIKILLAVVFGFLGILFIAANLGNSPKRETEPAQQEDQTQVVADKQTDDAPVKYGVAAQDSESPDSFMRRIADPGDEQISMGVANLYIDIRTCPEDSCEIIGIVPFMSGRVDAYIDQTSHNKAKDWVKVTYYGKICSPQSFDRKTGMCNNEYRTQEEIAGWVDFSSLDRERPQTFKQRREYYRLHDLVFKNRLFETTCSPGGTVVSDSIEKHNKYYLNKYYDEQSRKEIEEKIKEEINKKYSSTEAYCEGERLKYASSQQVWEQGVYQ